jgi:hypothetical protein
MPQAGYHASQAIPGGGEMSAERPLYPMRLYVYQPDGMHDEGIEITSQSQLNGPGTRMILEAAMARGVEIRMTDPGDFLVFHADKGKVLFPVPEAK